MLHKWPNHSNRTPYPSHIGLINARPMSSPVPLNQEYANRYTLYINEYDSLLQIKNNLDEKSSKIIIQLNLAESVKGGNAWSRKDNNKVLVKRLQQDLDVIKHEIIITEMKIDTLKLTNSSLVSLISIHNSCVKGYDDYIIWKEETNREISEIYMNAK